MMNSTAPRLGAATQDNDDGAPGSLQRLQLGELHEAPYPHPPAGVLIETFNPLHRVKARLQVCVGEATLTVGDLLAATEQQVITLDRHVDHPVDLMLEGKVIARGELVAVDDQFGIRITELPVALKV
jgi:flagellar motor switch protein FliN